MCCPKVTTKFLLLCINITFQKKRPGITQIYKCPILPSLTPPPPFLISHKLYHKNPLPYIHNTIHFICHIIIEDTSLISFRYKQHLFFTFCSLYDIWYGVL